MRGAVVVALVAASTVASVACADAPTSISVLITTTYECAETKGVSLAVSTLGVSGERALDARRCTDEEPEARIGTVTIVPGGANDAKVNIVVVGGVDRPAADCVASKNFGGCVVARRILRFAPNREIDVPVALRAECKGVVCDDQSTCVKGACRIATIEDPFACVGATCEEGSLRPAIGSVPPVDAGASGDGGSDAPVPVVQPDAGTVCGSSEKICDSRCVSSADPNFGCFATGCTPCAEMATGDYACAGDKCALLGCKPGFKRCGDTCAPEDPAHGCKGASCTACDATNGTAGCSAAGACDITCTTAFKLCGGKCVSVDDPTYGCSATGCSAASCPTPGAGTLACVGGACVIGSCGAGTKNCNQKCVPTDVQNGCQDPARCTACPSGNACSGAPSACTCVPESLATTCAGKSCGPATNNCGQNVTCPNKCQAPDVCGGGGAGKNGCGCSSTSYCGGMSCGYDIDNCGRQQSCGSCGYPEFCGGGGTNVCAAHPDGNCGAGWPTMGSFTCDAGSQVQTICGCYPPFYNESWAWQYLGGDCFRHYTGNPC